MARLRSGNAPTPARPAATGRPALREKTNTTITGTPGPAVETSMLALKNFKRRPRQGSMLEMVRKRRSSVQASLISAQPQQDDGDVEDTSVFDLGSASEGEDVFAPEAEGTPLQPSKTRKSTSTRKSLSAKKSVATTPAVKRTKRKSDEMDSPHSALDALKRKHNKSEVQPAKKESLPAIKDAHQSVVHDTSDHEASPVANPVESDVQVINSSPESTPPTEPPSSSTRKVPGTQEDFAVPSTEEQERSHVVEQGAQDEEEEEEEDDHDTLNATMAEPASSSPNGSPIPETQRIDIYADPLTQVSPPPPELAKTRSKGNKKPTALSTATLRALLPKRTQRPKPRAKRTEYDISSDSEEDDDDDTAVFDTTNLDDDEDELGGRLRRRRQKTKTPAPSRNNKKASTTAATKSKSKQALSTRKPSAPPPQPAKSEGKSKSRAKPTRTYGRNATSDKENDAGEAESSPEEDGNEAETSMTMREVLHSSKELEEARRKFAEVDNWDLTFESMSNEDHRSSSQGWR